VLRATSDYAGKVVVIHMLDGALSSQDGKKNRWCPGPES
jgi:hypothetical protein